MNYYGSCSKCYDDSMKPYMQGSCMYPAQNVQSMDIESMYPTVYYQLYPAVANYCNMAGIQQGMMVSPTKEQIQGMVEDIYTKVEPEIEPENEMMDTEGTRQFGIGFGTGFGRRRFLRDIIGILLIRELLRRRPYGYNYPGYYPGYYGY